MLKWCAWHQARTLQRLIKHTIVLKFVLVLLSFVIMREAIRGNASLHPTIYRISLHEVIKKVADSSCGQVSDEDKEEEQEDLLSK